MHQFTIIPRRKLILLYLSMLPAVFVVLLTITTLAFGRVEFIQRYGFFLVAFLAYSAIGFVSSIGAAVSISGDDRFLVFRRWHRPDVELQAGQILSVSPSRFRTNSVSIHHTSGTIHVTNRFSAFPELLEIIKRHSPTATIEGTAGRV